MSSVNTGDLKTSARDLLALGGQLDNISSTLGQAAISCSNALPGKFAGPADSLKRFASDWGQEAQLEAAACDNLASLLLQYASAIDSIDSQGAQNLSS